MDQSNMLHRIQQDAINKQTLNTKDIPYKQQRQQQYDFPQLTHILKTQKKQSKYKPFDYSLNITGQQQKQQHQIITTDLLQTKVKTKKTIKPSSKNRTTVQNGQIQKHIQVIQTNQNNNRNNGHTTLQTIKTFCHRIHNPNHIDNIDNGPIDLNNNNIIDPNQQRFLRNNSQDLPKDQLYNLCSDKFQQAKSLKTIRIKNNKSDQNQNEFLQQIYHIQEKQNILLDLSYSKYKSLYWANPITSYQLLMYKQKKQNENFQRYGDSIQYIKSNRNLNLYLSHQEQQLSERKREKREQIKQWLLSIEQLRELRCVMNELLGRLLNEWIEVDNLQQQLNVVVADMDQFVGEQVQSSHLDKDLDKDVRCDIDINSDNDKDIEVKQQVQQQEQQVLQQKQSSSQQKLHQSSVQSYIVLKSQQQQNGLLPQSQQQQQLQQQQSQQQQQLQQQLQQHHRLLQQLQQQSLQLSQQLAKLQHDIHLINQQNTNSLAIQLSQANHQLINQQQLYNTKLSQLSYQKNNISNQIHRNQQQQAQLKTQNHKSTQTIAKQLLPNLLLQLFNLSYVRLQLINKKLVTQQIKRLQNNTQEQSNNNHINITLPSQSQQFINTNFNKDKRQLSSQQQLLRKWCAQLISNQKQIECQFTHHSHNNHKKQCECQFTHHSHDHSPLHSHLLQQQINDMIHNCQQLSSQLVLAQNKLNPYLQNNSNNIHHLSFIMAQLLYHHLLKASDQYFAIKLYLSYIENKNISLSTQNIKTIKQLSQVIDMNSYHSMKIKQQLFFYQSQYQPFISQFFYCVVDKILQGVLVQSNKVDNDGNEDDGKNKQKKSDDNKVNQKLWIDSKIKDQQILLSTRRQLLIKLFASKSRQINQNNFNEHDVVDVKQTINKLLAILNE